MDLDAERLATLREQAPLIAAGLEALTVEFAEGLGAYLVTLDGGVAVDSTSATARCHLFARDGDGRFRVEPLAELLAQHVLTYAIPRSRVQSAYEHYEQTNSAHKVVRLNSEARRLFTDLKLSGEGGEVLLYLLANVVLRIPQVICKMPLKTNTRMHFHGADGVHAAYDPATDRLCLYWGESKLHKTLSSAVSECMKGLAPFLLQNELGARERDLQLLRDHVDLDNEELESAFRAYLDPDNPLFLQCENRGIALVGYELDEYPDTSQEIDELRAEVRDALASAQERLSEHINGNGLADTVIEVFCVPMPSVQELRDHFFEHLGIPVENRPPEDSGDAEEPQE